MKKKYLPIGTTIFIIIVLASIFVIFNNLSSSSHLFSWQKEKYCSFEAEVVSFETRCGFQVVTSFEDGDPSNPLWYARQDDKDLIKDHELSNIDVTMWIRNGQTFPISRADIEAYWQEGTQHAPYKLEAKFDSLSIDGKKAWKIMQTVEGDIPNYGHSSIALGQIIIERDEKSIYIINIMSASDSSEKMQAYLKESNHIIDSIRWK